MARSPFECEQKSKKEPKSYYLFKSSSWREGNDNESYYAEQIVKEVAYVLNRFPIIPLTFILDQHH